MGGGVRISLAACAALLVAGVVPAGASALTWTTPFELPGRETSIDLNGAPEVAVNRRGQAIVSWISDGGRSGFALGDAARGSWKRIGVKGFSFTDELAIAPQGHAIIVGDDGADEELYHATVSRSGRVGPRRLIAKSFYDDAVAALPDGSFMIVHARAKVLRTLRVTRSGKPKSGGILGRKATALVFGAGPDGSLFACCDRAGSRAIKAFTYPAPGGWRAHTIKLGAGEPVPEYDDAEDWSVESSRGTFLLRGPGSARLLRGTKLRSLEPERAWSLDGSGRAQATYIDAGKLWLVTAGADGTVGAPVELGPAGSDPGFGATAPWASGTLTATPRGGFFALSTIQNGALRSEPNLDNVTAGSFQSIASARDAVALTWYDNNHHAFAAIGRP